MITRKRNRLSDYDYSQYGVYFVTICTKERKNLFWVKDNIVGASIARPNDGYVLSDMGKIAEDGIKNIPQYYPVNIDCYVVMPNHVHILMGIVADGGRAMLAPTLSGAASQCGGDVRNATSTLSNIVRQYKGYVTKKIGFSPWQKSFHDHIVRNRDEYLKIFEYIKTNPLKWNIDKYYTED
mgnify:CR=1 FL=1